jgi:1-acyl-sn-glycerol-3-phosphate acyltransferase
MVVGNNADALPAGPAAREAALIAVVRELVREVHGERGRLIDVGLSSRLERDLGIDSLGRTELILRIERAFLVRLPISVMGEAETVRDVLSALEHSGAAGGPLIAPPIVPELPPVSAATDARTLIEALDWHIEQHPDRLHVTLLQDDSTVIAKLTYGELARAARAAAAGLFARDILPGDRVALMLPTSIDFFVAFFAILYAGAVPVPIYPPMQLTQIEEYARRQAGILRNSGARMLITVPEGLRLGSLLRTLVATIETVESVARLSGAAAHATMPSIRDGSAMALIQYTSGSTGDPKGVVLSHANLLANIRAIGSAINASSADVLVSWLPLYHDMGLIGAWLGCLYFGAPFYVMSPLTFLARPQIWLWTIHRFRGTISAAPNFAFELCLSKIDDAALEGLDLSSLRIVANGAEPVSVQTLQRFLERFGRYGFRREAMAPVYGLAECAVAVTVPPPNRPPLIDRISRKALSLRGIAEKSADERDVMEVVACGQPLPGHEVRILDDLGHELGERREGRLQFRGPSATSGYFNNEAKTRELFYDGWLETGDRAYLAEGDLFITGRIKDIVIRAGQHIYPHEVEEAVGNVPGLRKAAAAAFGLTDAVSGTERLVVVAEADAADPVTREALRARAQEAVVDAIGMAPDEIVLVQPGAVPKTSSGKIRRGAARELYLAGQFEAQRPAMKRQLFHLALAGLGSRALRLSRRAGEFLYAVWWWAVIAAGFVLGTLAVLLLPRLSWRWAAIRKLARMALAAVGAPVSASGLDRLPRGSAVLLCNHSSYVDVLVLAALIAGEPIYLAKREFADQIYAGTMLRRLGVLFVDRYDLAGSLADIAAATAAAKDGRLLVIFPEGTFTRRAGLSGFYLGGFKLASEAGLPVYPAALRGTRSMLRAGEWLPHRTSLSLEIAEAVRPSGKDFASVLRLRDTVRAAILARCGEPDVNELIKPPAPQSPAHEAGAPSA